MRPVSLLAAGCALVAAGCLLLGCGKANVGSAVVGPAVKLAIPPMPDGEVNSYRISIQGVPVGARVQSTSHITQNNVTPAFVFTTIDRVRPGNFDRLDSTIVFATRDSLIPMAGFHFRRTGPVLVTAAALYRPGSVGITTYDPRSGEACRALPLPAGTFDANQMWILGRAIRLPLGGSAEVVAIQILSEPPGGAFERTTVSPGTDEMLTVPAGTFDCSQLLMVKGTDTIRLWYEKTGSHRLVRSLGSDGQLVELVP